MILLFDKGNGAFEVRDWVGNIVIGSPVPVSNPLAADVVLLPTGNGVDGDWLVDVASVEEPIESPLLVGATIADVLDNGLMDERPDAGT